MAQSTMKTILFINSIHFRIDLFDLLAKIFEKRFIVRKKLINPDCPSTISKADKSADVVVLAGVDGLIPMYISNFSRVVVLQVSNMHSTLPDAHWLLNNQATYINFSQSIHVRTVSLGCESLLVKYAPNIDNFDTVNNFKEIRYLPQNCSMTSQIYRQKVESIIAGLARICDPNFQGNDLKLYTASTQEDLRSFNTIPSQPRHGHSSGSALDPYNIYIAPSIVKGFEQEFLNAMARGMIVIAPDLPPYNEYISNWCNGILIDNSLEDYGLKETCNLSKISSEARSSIKEDYYKWKNDEKLIGDFIENCPVSSVPDLKPLRRDLERIASSYRLGVSSYAIELKNCSLTVELMSQWRDYNIEEPEYFLSERPRSLNLLFGMGNAKIFQKSGFSLPEETHTWTDSHQAIIEIPNIIIPYNWHAMQFKARLRSIELNRIDVIVDGNRVAILETSPHWSEHEFKLELVKDLEYGHTTICFMSDKLFSPGAHDNRTLGVAIAIINISTIE